MASAIKIETRFHTVEDTARTLGVPERRVKKLIAKARRMTDRYLALRDSSKVVSRVKGRAKGKSAATVAGKSSERNAGTRIVTAKSKAAKVKG